MTFVATLAAVLGFGEAARRLARAVLPVSSRWLRAALALVLGSALLCSAYGVLGALCEYRTSDIELVMHGEVKAAPRDSTTQGAGEVRIFEERVVNARATPKHLAPIAIACALLAIAFDRRHRPPLPPAHDRLVAVTYVPVALSALAALRSVARGYDALWYHLPMAAAFAQTGHLGPPGRDLVSYFPADVELLSRTLGDLFGPRGLPLVQAPFALALGPLVAALARRVGAQARYAAALALGCPIVAFQAGLAYADVVSLAALTAALVLLVDPRASWLRDGAAGLCLGLSLGSKYAALPLLASGVPLLLAAWRRIPGISIGVALPSWFWFARNLRLTGNPLFPIAVPWLHLRGLFTPRSFNGDKELELVGSRIEWLVHPWMSALTHETGFGALFAVIVPLSIVPLVVIGWRRRGRMRLALPFAWGLVYLASWWLGTPHEVRHLLPLVVLFGVPACRLLRGRTPLAVGLRSVATVAVLAGTGVVLRIQLFTPSPEESIHARSFFDEFGIPGDVLDGLPAGARVDNTAGRPYDYALLGPHLTLRYTEYVPGLPTAQRLEDEDADFVFARGDAATVEKIRASADSVRRPLVVRYQGTVEADAEWRFWGATATDTVVLFERTRSRAILGVLPVTSVK